MNQNPLLHLRWNQELSRQQLRAALERGDRCVRFRYVLSFVFVTCDYESTVHLMPATSDGTWRGLPYCLITMLFGWWGLPYGPIQSVAAIRSWMDGGEDVTDEIWDWLNQETDAN